MDFQVPSARVSSYSLARPVRRVGAALHGGAGGEGLAIAGPATDLGDCQGHGRTAGAEVDHDLGGQERSSPRAVGEGQHVPASAFTLDGVFSAAEESLAIEGEAALGGCHQGDSAAMVTQLDLYSLRLKLGGGGSFLRHGGAKAGQAERQDHGYSDSAQSTHGMAIHVPSPWMVCRDSGAGCSRRPEPSPRDCRRTASANECSLIGHSPSWCYPLCIADAPSGKFGNSVVGAEPESAPSGDPHLFGSPDSPQDRPLSRGRSIHRYQLRLEKAFGSFGSAELLGLQKTTPPSLGLGSLHVEDSSSQSSLGRS